MNPPAEVSTSLKVYQGHTLEKTYLGEDFFWAITPMAGDYVLFKFDKPVHVERLVLLLRVIVDTTADITKGNCSYQFRLRRFEQNKFTRCT